jgi:hypothetical protein
MEMKASQLLTLTGIGVFISVAMTLADAAVAAEQAEFVDRAKEAGLADAPGYGKAVSIIDVNGDGWEDLWDSNTNQRQPSPKHPSVPRFYLNKKDGSFKPYDLGIDPDDLEFSWGAAWADFDNDGDPDLLIASGGLLGRGSLALYENRWKEQQKLVKLPAGIAPTKRQWWGASWGDFDNDGCVDFAAIARENRAWIYRNNCDKTFTEVAQKLGIAAAFKDGKNPVWFDIDNDGDQDLYLSASRFHRLYRNDGDARFADITSRLGDFKPLPLTVASVSADFNHDGNLDLYLGRQMDQDMIAFGAGDGTFKRAGRQIGIKTKIRPDRSENTMGLGLGDVDNDGHLDILIGTGSPDQKQYDLVFCSRPKDDGKFGVEFYSCGSFAKEGHGKIQTHGIALGDLDQDGSNDIVFNLGGAPGWDVDNGAESRGMNTLYSRKGGNNQTAQFRLEGVDSNRDAIGARIRVTVSPEGKPPQIFHYSVRSAEGFQSQNSSWQLVNLMGTEQAAVELRWPSGRVSQHTIRVGAREIFREPPPSQ